MKNLYRHTNGVYYGRISVGNRKMWKSLRTKLKSVAEKTLDKHRTDVRGSQPAEIEISEGETKLTLGSALDALRHVLDLAVESGRIFSNRARDKATRRATPKMKRLHLPSRAQFVKMIKAIEASGCGMCKAAAEMAQFLAFTGARQREANHVTWADVDFNVGRVTLYLTKNGEPRDVPMIPECRALLTKMRGERSSEGQEFAVLQVKSCNGFLRRASEKVGVSKVSHHDFRHLFATAAIEAGIDVPTISRIMGHRDGGALAMKVYGHLRNEHAHLAMQKVILN